MIKIATWNVNSIKSRLSHLTEYLRSDDAPDVLLLQELKCMTEAFPYMEVEECGYNVAVHGQKTYNGVAILSKYPLEDVVKNLPNNTDDEQARYIEALVLADDKVIRVASVYVPNGQSPDSDKFQYKMRFLDCLHNHVSSLIDYEEILIVGGDYNISPDAEKDTYDAKRLEGGICCHPEERKKYRGLLNLGLTDAFRSQNPDIQQFSWWDYRAGAWQHNKGLRIDHLLLSPQAADIQVDSNIFTDLRAKDKPSDHTPVWVDLKL